MTQLTPFQTFVSSDTYFVNAGKVINYFNPVNYRDVRVDRDSIVLPNISRNIEMEAAFGIQPDIIKIEIFLFASFSPPLFWVPGNAYVPKINNAWIVRREQFTDFSYQTLGTINNKSSLDIRFESLGFANGYACNLGPVAILDWNGSGYDVNQIVRDNYIFSRLFDSISYSVHNGEIDGSQEDVVAANLETESQLIKTYHRGYIETSNSLGEGMSAILNPNELPEGFGYENQRT